MKKLLAMMLALVLVFALAACGGDTEDTVSSASSAAGTKAESSAEATSSEEAVSSEASSSEASSSEEVSSDDTSSGGEATDTPPAFIDNFLSVGAVDTKVTANSDTAIRLTGVDAELTYGSIVLFSEEYGLLDGEELAEYAVAEFTYSQEVFGYVKTAFYKIGEAEEIEAPADGFLVAAHSDQELYIGRLEALTETDTVYPHGLRLFDDLDYSVAKAETSPTIDGSFSEDEWGDYFVDDVDAENPAWAYPQFEKDNYYATARYYTTYDDEYLYLCVVVTSPYHYCPIEQSKAGDMWQYECIQVKVSSQSPNSDYILENFDHVANGTAVKEGVVRSYGFAVNDYGDTCYYESGYTTTFTGLAGCSRDDANQTTVYEVAIPFAEFDITPEAGMTLGLTFSINSTNEEDVEAGVWKNITYRHGGGVIGRNDWSKIPEITLD